MSRSWMDAAASKLTLYICDVASPQTERRETHQSTCQF
ncbi:putative disease resistance protein [Zea mays]|uniref:Putative disease resistance protein n=1 Tax=Zea mays TaxID=4577 RepID=A0A1D6KET3_MAIZE|nr:putative disease resistance protein [Zea mays]